MSNDIKKKKITKRIVIVAVIVIALVAIYLYISNGAKKILAEAANSYIKETEIKRGDIDVKLTGSGSVSALSKFNVLPSFSGKVTSVKKNVGDTVKEDTVICVVDGKNIKSPAPGTILTLNVKKNDYIVNNQITTATMGTSMTEQASQTPIAVIVDMTKMQVTLEVDELDIAKLKVRIRSKCIL